MFQFQRSMNFSREVRTSILVQGHSRMKRALSKVWIVCVTHKSIFHVLSFTIKKLSHHLSELQVPKMDVGRGIAPLMMP